jgi:hypothetical protein
VKVLFNEDKPLGFLRVEEAVEFLLYQRTIHLQFQSPEKIQDDLEDFAEIVIEGLQIKKEKVRDKKEKLKMGRLIKRVEGFIVFARYKKTNLKLTAHIFEFMLSLNNLGTLAGFGFGNKFGDKLMGNSEKVSLRNIRTLLKE